MEGENSEEESDESEEKEGIIKMGDTNSGKLREGEKTEEESKELAEREDILREHIGNDNSSNNSDNSDGSNNSDSDSDSDSERDKTAEDQTHINAKKRKNKGEVDLGSIRRKIRLNYKKQHGKQQVGALFLYSDILFYIYIYIDKKIENERKDKNEVS